MRTFIAPHEYDRPRGILLEKAGDTINSILDKEEVDCIGNLSEGRCSEIISELTSNPLSPQ